MKNLKLDLTYPALILAIIIWGLSFVSSKIALESFPAYSLIMIRFGAAAILFFILLLIKGFPKFEKKDNLLIFLTSVFQPVLYFIFETFGIQQTSASLASLLIATIPILVLILSVIFLGAKLKPVNLIGIGLSFLGIALLVVGDHNFEWPLKGSMAGYLFMFGAVFSASIYMILINKLSSKYSAFHITSVQIIYGSILFIPIYLLNYEPLVLENITGDSVIALVFLVVLSTVVAFLSYNYALSRIESSKAAIFINAIPAVTAFAAWLLRGEMLTNTQLVGGLIVILSVSIVTKKSKQKQKDIKNITAEAS